MMDSLKPLKSVQQEGITFDEFLWLAKANLLDVEAIRVLETDSIEEFRKCIMMNVKKDDVFIALSYSRSILSQTGGGHFSPVGGYHKDKDLILILDTARFKYPPHWVPVSLIWESMKAIDEWTGKSRGYMIIRRYENI